MDVPEDRRYTAEHEWVSRVSDDRVRIGITDYAQDALGDVVYVELPNVDRQVEPGDTLAEVESTKSVAEVYAPVAGRVVAVNDLLNDHPELVNGAPYGDGWFLELEISPEVSIDSLINAAEYAGLTAE